MMRMATLIVLALLLFAPTLYAQNGTHPLVEAGLATPLNLSQTIDPVTATLDWAYADTQGFTLQVTVTGLTPELQQALTGALTSTARLRDTMGNEFTFQGGAVGQPDSEGTMVNVFTYYSQAVRQNGEMWEIDTDYFNNQYETLPSSLDLQLELNFVDPNTLYAPEEGASPTATPAVDPIGPFLFDFTVPLPAPVELEPQQTVKVNDLAMTLETLQLTPTQAEARMCIELPDGSDWQPQPSITIDGAEGSYAGGGVIDVAQFENDERRCFDLRFNALNSDEAETVVVSLDAIEKSMQEGTEDWLRIQDALADEGIEMTVESQGQGVSAEIPNLPEGMTFMDAVKMAREDLGDRISGPWVFEVELP